MVAARNSREEIRKLSHSNNHIGFDFNRMDMLSAYIDENDNNQ